MICTDCERRAALRLRGLTAIQKAKENAIAYGKENNCMVEIVKTKEGSFTWLKYGEQHDHQHVEFIPLN